MPLTEIYGDAARTINVGQGINSLTGELLAKAIEFNLAQQDSELTSGSGGLVSESILTRLDSVQEVRQNLEINASASFGFGIFNSDLSYDHLEQSNMQRFSTFVLARVKALDVPRLLLSIKLTEDAIEIYNEDIDKFIERYGTKFVNGVVTGGELAALLEVVSTTTSEQTLTRSSVDASLGLFVSGSLTFVETIQHIASTTSINLHIIRHGTRSSIPDISTLIAAANAFPEEIADPANQVPMKVLFESYSLAENLPTTFPNILTLGQKEDDLITLADFHDEAKQRRTELRYASLHTDEFLDFTQEAYAERFGQVQDVITKYVNAAIAIASNQQASVSPLPLPKPFKRHEAKPVNSGWVVLEPNLTKLIAVVRNGQTCTVDFQGRWAAGTPASIINPFCSAKGLSNEQTGIMITPPWGAPILVSRPKADIGMFCAVIQLFEFGKNAPTRTFFAKDSPDPTGTITFVADSDYEVRVSMRDFPNYFGDNINDPSNPMYARVAAA